MHAVSRWIDGAIKVAPRAGTSLVERRVRKYKRGVLYGFYVSAQEPNDFVIRWTSGGRRVERLIVHSGPGTTHYESYAAYNAGSLADSDTTIEIVVLKDGSEGVRYQAGILYSEV